MESAFTDDFPALLAPGSRLLPAQGRQAAPARAWLPARPEAGASTELDTAVTGRPVALSREGSVFRLTFGFHPDLVTRVRTLPSAVFDGQTKTWTARVCSQSVTALRDWFYQGLTDKPVDSLLDPGETLVDLAPAELRHGTLRRPFVVSINLRSDAVYARLRAIPGASWDKASGAMSFPATAAPALAELVDQKIVSDPAQLMRPAGVVVSFDSRTGLFVVRGDDRAATAFEQGFPGKDVVGIWMSRGLDVAFSDSLSEEVYRGEIARAGEGLEPEGLLLPLMPHQRVNVAMSTVRQGLLVADTPGVGKTPTGIAAGWYRLGQGRVSRVVVVVPGALRSQWVAEILRFTPTLPDEVVVVLGDAKKRRAAYARAQHAKWFIVHFDVLSRDEATMAPLFDGAYLVVDEAHRIKGHQAKRSIALRTLARRSAARLAMTGTPLDNDPGEFFQILNFTVPNCLGTWQDFAGRYQYPGRFGGYEGARNLGELRRRTRVHMIRHTKSEVAKHLPPLRVSSLVLDPDDAYALALRRAHRLAKEEIAGEATDRRAKTLRAERGGKLTEKDEELLEQIEAGATMTAVGMLRALCSSPRLVAASDAPAAKILVEAGLIPDADGPKLDQLRDTAAAMAADGQRLVVFTGFRTMAELIAARLREDGISCVTYTGKTSMAERDAAVAAFTTPATDDNAGPTVFVATDAAAEGLNLGRCCSTLINFDLPYTPGRMEQRSNRIHRIDGAAANYQVVNYLVAGTIEAAVLKMLEKKADISGALLGELDARRRITGRGGRNAFEGALQDWAA